MSRSMAEGERAIAWARRVNEKAKKVIEEENARIAQLNQMAINGNEQANYYRKKEHALSQKVEELWGLLKTKRITRLICYTRHYTGMGRVAMRR